MGKQSAQKNQSESTRDPALHPGTLLDAHRNLEMVTTALFRRYQFMNEKRKCGLSIQWNIVLPYGGMKS